MVETKQLSFVCPKRLNISAWGEKPRKLGGKEKPQRSRHTQRNPKKLEGKENWIKDGLGRGMKSEEKS